MRIVRNEHFLEATYAKAPPHTPRFYYMLTGITTGQPLKEAIQKMGLTKTHQRCGIPINDRKKRKCEQESSGKQTGFPIRGEKVDESNTIRFQRDQRSAVKMSPPTLVTLRLSAIEMLLC